MKENLILKVKDWLKTQPAIYLHPKHNIKKPKDIVDIMVLSGERTYHDRPGTSVQCLAKRNRSLNDILVCIKTYFPKLKLRDFFKLIWKTITTVNEELNGVSIFYCPDIKKWVLNNEDYGDFDFSEMKFYINGLFKTGELHDLMPKNQDLFRKVLVEQFLDEYQAILTKE